MTTKTTSVIEKLGHMAGAPQWAAAVFQEGEKVNVETFLSINSAGNPSALIWNVSLFFAEYAIWIIPVLMPVIWCIGGRARRMRLLTATVSALAGLSVNLMLGLLWYHPRPFMAGIGHVLITHAPDSSFPSDHLTLLWSVGCALLIRGGLRYVGAAMMVLGVPMAWARIYLGVHYPLDMIGSLSVAVCCAWMANRYARQYLPLIYCSTTWLYRGLFSSAIRKRWLAK